MSDIIERFRQRAVEDPSAQVFSFFDDDGREEVLRAGDLARSAEAGAAHLRGACGLAAGDRALLVYPPSLDFVKALLGCLYAGVIPVPLPPPDPLRPGADLARFGALAEDSGARAVLTNTRYTVARAMGTARNVLSRPWKRWPDLPWHATDRWKPGAHRAPPVGVRRPDDTAFLQYTSGSTSRPKGVIISYGNLDHQLALNARALGLGPTARMVAWVPHFHDFGLISGIMSALYGNGCFSMLSPLTFIQKPQRWFDAMHRARATHTAAPTFGYEYAVRKTTARERAGWDLSSLRVAMCAAEPIHPETERRFQEAFAPSRLRPGVFCPSYGLAEHTVGVSLGGRGLYEVSRSALEREGVAQAPTQGQESKTLVACGTIADDVRVRVVDPASGRALPDDRVGELWVDSPSKGLGYYGLPDETKRTFRAKLEGDEAEYLRTGDLGLLHAGQVYITGRLKDLIIVRGRNVYPQDLEETIRDGHPLIRPGGVAVFSVEERASDGTLEERLVVLVEVRDAKLAPSKSREVAQAIRQLVNEEHQLSCKAVVLAAPGAVLKTTSGKVQRRACRDAYASGALQKAAVFVSLGGDSPGDSAPSAPAATPAPASVVTQSVSEITARSSSGDPRRGDLDEGFARLCSEMETAFVRMTKARRGRVFHKQATTLRGTLQVLAHPEIPAHGFFAPDAAYDVIVRHANGVQEDDAAWDNRGATVRVLPAGASDLTAPLLDLLLTTGGCFLASTASEFARWMAADAPSREAIVRAEPHRGAAAWEMFRAPRSYASLHYHSKIASRFEGRGGEHAWARFRLVPADRSADTGFVDAGGALIPPEVIPRATGDVRSKTFLHEELRERLAQGPIRYLLQAQLRPAASREENEDALDCTRPWSQPWRDVAALTLDALVDEARVEPLCFDPYNAPADLSLPLARSANERASLGHLRSVVYAAAARARRDEALSGTQPVDPSPSPEASKPRGRRRVCVIGAGASGLAAAWALEREGHEVTVLERAPAVAGKCASLEVDGRFYDWGGHLCTAHYTSLASMADALGCEREPATPTLVYDLETRAVRPREDTACLRQEFLRYTAARDAGFREITRPGLHRVAGALAQPVDAWLRGEDLRALGAAIGLNYTACGYGYLDDPELAAVYLCKAAELGGILSTGKSSGLPEAWTVRGGFGAFWRRVAGGLRDVRCGVTVRAIERSAEGVDVHVGDARMTFDELVVASPLDEALAYLDASGEERALFSKVRYLDYHTIACRARGLPRDGFYLLKQHCEDARKVGHSVAFHHRYEGSDVYLFYAYGTPETGLPELTARLREDVALMGGELDEVLDHRRWKYFPHAASRDLAEGYLDRIEALQGQRRTYYVGSLFNFELIEANVSYAHDLVARFFRGETHIAQSTQDARPEGLAASLAKAPSAPARAELLRSYLVRLFVEELRLPETPSGSTRFLDLGFDSVRSVEIFQRLMTDTGARTLAPVIFFDHPTFDELSTYLSTELPASGASAPRPRPALKPASNARTYPGRVVESELYTQIEDVVFADAHGVGLTLDVFVPTGPSNQLAVVDVVSALWSSGRDVILNHKVLGTYDAFCRQGFTVFAVRPGSAPPFHGEQMVDHIRQAIRWVKSQSRAYNIDPARVGLLGGSAGGHLACLAAMTPVEASAPGLAFDSGVQALVAHCPMTRYRPEELDPAHAALHRQVALPADSERTQEALEARYAAISPLTHVNPGAPPTRIFHATGDRVVPFAASEEFISALRSAGVSAELTARDSDKHPWPGIEKDMVLAAAWMESTLRANAPSSRGWLRVVRAVASPAKRLVCVHHAGGSSAMFDAFPAGLPDDVEVLAVELPGRGARADEPACTELSTVLAALDEVLSPLLDRPLALFGHSLGAVIAFELCRRLRRRNAPLPSRLIVSGFVGPRVYDPSLALTEGDLGPALALGGPSLEADYRLFHSWSFTEEPPLEVPITALGASDDPTAPPAGVEAWSRETRASFAHETLRGHHFYLLNDPAPLLARLVRDLDELGADALATRWRARPYALSGAWNSFDLAWLARVSAPDSSRPAFPEALDALRLAQRDDGGVGSVSPHPYCNVVTALAFAGTLLRWNDGAQYDRPIERSLAYACAEHERAQAPSGANDRGRFFHFRGFFGQWLIPARECAALLERGERLLSAEARRMAHTYAAASDVSFSSASPADYERFFDEDSLSLHFAEYLPEAAFASVAAREHARRASSTGLPGLTAAGAARYYEASRDPSAREQLGAALARPFDGLRPGGRLQELQFSLAYLLRGGVDIEHSFARELDELRSTLRAEGVGVEPGARLPDADASAVSQVVCHALGLTTPMPTRTLERFWNAERSSYQSADGYVTYSVSTTLHVLEAYLVASDVTPDEQLAVWQRVTGLLEARPWVELHHLSPHYIWEKVVSIVGEHEQRFPGAPTRVHRDALEQILGLQDASGGFHGAVPGAPTREETALALLALRSALAWTGGLDDRQRVIDAARGARAYLLRAPRTKAPDLWVGKLLYAPDNLIEAIVTAALEG